MNERSAYIALNLMDGIGPVIVRALVAELGSAAAIFEAGKSDLVRASGVGLDAANKILTQRSEVDPDAEVERARKVGAHIVVPIDEGYPRSLQDIHDPPLALCIQGELAESDKRAVAIVGARRATHYGRDCAEKLAYQLVQAGFVVVSGLAHGIDTAAHKGALKAGGRTLAVIGSGLGHMYPPENRDLAKTIAGSGVVMSEFAIDRKPDKTTFPIRNRIVSGLSLGVVVVEAGVRSGAMITVQQGLEQGKSVFAVPGRIDSPLARGPHQLIRDGARLVEDVEDILEEFEFLIPPHRQETKAAASGPILSDDERILVDRLADGPSDVDSLIRGSGLSASTVSSLLIGLEMKKVARMLPGRMVELRAGRLQ
jgi:DNA processing protein